MAYTVFDFSESLDRLKEFKVEDVAECVAAWGENGCCAEWTGGFKLRLKDGRYAYLTGWCDTTGWGCQDGIDITFYDSDPGTLEPDKEWDEGPTDLNRYLRGEIEPFD